MNLRLLFIVVSSGLLFTLLAAILIPNQAAEANSMAELAAIPQASIGPDSVTIDGPVTGDIDVSYTFTATVSPANTTQPITYTWEATNQSPVITTSGLTHALSYTWHLSSTHFITVTASNDWGSISETHTIVTAHPPINFPALDTAVAFDVSGSMDWETNCFGCWTKDHPAPDIMTNPYPANGTFLPLNYEPNAGGSYTIFWDSGTSDHPVCSAAPSSTPFTESDSPFNTYNYLVHEAEFYSRNHPHNGWEFDKRVAGQGFWVLQQTPAIDSPENASNDAYISAHPLVTYSQSNLVDFPQIQGAAYNSDCFTFDAATGTGAADGQCWSSKGLPDPVNNNPPFVEYDFTPDWNGELHIWMRVVGGWIWSFEWDGQSPSTLIPYRTQVFWQLDDGKVEGPNLELIGRKSVRYAVATTTSSGGRDKWRWVKVADEQLTDPVVSGQQHTLRIYQGSTDFNIDKIILTNNPEGVVGTTIADTGQTVLGAINDTDPNNAGEAVLDSAVNNLDIANDVLSLNNGQGPDVTPGSATREACNICNPAFGQTVDPSQCSCKTNAADGGNTAPGGGSGTTCTLVEQPTNQLTDDLFYDRAPLRNAKEAVKNFAALLDPEFDQLGVVPFSASTPDRTKLQCLVFGGIDFCVGDTSPITYSFVIKALEDYTNFGGTNIARGMREGLEELGVSVPGYNDDVGHDCPDIPINPNNIPNVLDDDNKQACDRQGAAQRVLILMTDGSPNNWPGFPNDPGNCPDDAEALWRGQFGSGYQAYDCAIFFAEAAANNNMAVYTVGLGPGVNVELLTAMAEGTDPNPIPGDDGFYFEPHCGQFFSAANLSSLDPIFEQILILARNCAQPAAPPSIRSLTGYTVQQGDILLIELVDHPPGDYDVYLENPATSAIKICSATATGDSTQVSCNLSLLNPPIPVGSYWLYSTVAGASNIVAIDPNEVDVLAGAVPAIVVDGGNVWADNETTSLTLQFHNTGILYDVKLFDPSGFVIAVITDSLDISLDNTIPWPVDEPTGLCTQANGQKCTIRSFEAGTANEVARTEVQINQPRIELSNGTGPYARGETVYVRLFSHTPGRAYTVLITGPDQEEFTSIDTNSNGDTPSPIIWDIPSVCGFGAGWPDSPPNYTVTSHPLGQPTAPAIATFDDVEIQTPPGPFITVDGGYTWEAGSFINIRVLQHLADTAHYLEFDGARIPTTAIDDTFLTDGCGEAIIDYTIPLTQAGGTYPVTSFKMNDEQQATRNLMVLAGAPPSELIHLPIIMKQ